MIAVRMRKVLAMWVGVCVCVLSHFVIIVALCNTFFITKCDGLLLQSATAFLLDCASIILSVIQQNEHY